MQKAPILAAFVLLTLTVYGQKDTSSRGTRERRPVLFSAGLTAQPLISWVGSGTEGLHDDGARAGFMYGPNLEFGITPNIWVGLSIYHVIMGSNTRFEETDTLGNRYVTRLNHNLQYLEVPLSLKMKTNVFAKRWSIWGKFGASAAVHLTSQTELTRLENEIMTENVHFNSDQGFSLFRGSVLVGAGFECNLIGNTRMVGGIQFNNGFTNFLKDDLNGAVPTPGKEVGRLKYIELVIAVMF